VPKIVSTPQNTLVLLNAENTQEKALIDHESVEDDKSGGSTPREIRTQYDPKEHKFSFDGWGLYKKHRFNM